MFAHHLDRHQMDQLKECWNQFDLDKDGTLTLSQFKNVMKEWDHGTNTDIEAMFKNLQWSESQEIRFSDLLAAFSYQRLVAVDERLWEAFATLDVDGDMKITKEQITAVLTKFDDEKAEYRLFDDVMKRKMTLYVDRAIEDVDGNGDGMIDFEEFLSALHPKFAGKSPKGAKGNRKNSEDDQGDGVKSIPSIDIHNSMKRYKSHKKIHAQ